jgi:DNA-binding NarL/FixJ family response regulator
VALLAPSTQETTSGQPTADELALLTLLSQGYTDEVVAQKLGLTGRTLRRRLRSAMDKLDASSRFQAGFKLAQSGWLDDDVLGE